MSSLDFWKKNGGLKFWEKMTSVYIGFSKYQLFDYILDTLVLAGHEPCAATDVMYLYKYIYKLGNLFVDV